jgi:hypothetical protein
MITHRNYIRYVKKAGIYASENDKLNLMSVNLENIDLEELVYSFSHNYQLSNCVNPTNEQEIQLRRMNTISIKQRTEGKLGNEC